MPTKITPFLWFDNQAEQAAKFYTSLFENSKVTSITHYGPDGPGPQGSVMTVDFTLEGREFTALNGGPHFKFTEAVSFVIHCRTQKEIDFYWDKLSKEGTIQQCGWLKDRYGLSWQIVPNVLLELIQDKDAAKVRRVMQAMMQMVKIDIGKIEEAAARG